MDFAGNPHQYASIVSLLLLLLLKTHRELSLLAEEPEEDLTAEEDDILPIQCLDSSSVDMDIATHVVLQHWRLWAGLSALDEDLGFWVKPRSTTWFTKFLLEEYDDDRWINLFRMTKRSVFHLANILAPSISKKNTRYRLAVPVLVRVACTLFKLSHGASLLLCSEVFAVGRSTMSMILRDVVWAINVVLRKEISWPRADEVMEVAGDFENLCGLPGILGAIDGTHFAISKPKLGPSDYYYFKSGGYTMHC